MTKVFRLYKDGDERFQDWSHSPIFPYNKGNRSNENMPDPDGASAKHEITSIPSPFARIDLVKTAFAEVCSDCKSGNSTDVSRLCGDTIHHKMVSDTLDAGEIFFNFDKLTDKVEIITWNPMLMIQTLKESDNSGQQIYADALDKYILSDGATYNFDANQNFYLLNYLHGPNALNIIGATSPASLFFSTANNLNYIQDIAFGQDKPFDGNFQPLYKRDPEYILSFFYYQRCFPNFATRFPEIAEYLDLTFRAIEDNDLKDALNKVSTADSTRFNQIFTQNGQQKNIVEVSGNALLQKCPAVYKSEFTIRSPKQPQAKVLVLPVESGNAYAKLKYTTATWGETFHAPYKVQEENVQNRTLPNDGTQQPYLTISDFLEDSIITVPHRLHKGKDGFFGAHFEPGNKKMSFLLPLKPLFFSFFSVEDLKGDTANGLPSFQMDLLAGNSVKVTLRVPITGNGYVNAIEYTRIYYYSRKAAVNAELNEGGMTELDFTAFIMPNIRFQNESDAMYRATCVSTFSQKYTLSFYKDDGMLDDITMECRNQNNVEPYKAETYQLEHRNFDYIRVTGNGCNGLIIPNFRMQTSIEDFEFAVDLGTSNTHIEYKKSEGNQSKVFDINDNDAQICHVFLPSTIAGTNIQDDLLRENELIERDFLPDHIGEESDFKFPTCTALSYAAGMDKTKTIAPFNLVNVPMTYEKREKMGYNRIADNIKWGDMDNNAIEVYIECVMLMIRNKVLLNNGNLPNTKITWFYPISMPPKRLTKFRGAWNTAYRKYFATSLATNAMNESAAPIQYYFRRYSTVKKLVNIDIGGGTTDVACALDDKIQCVTSFRFASNILFENPYSDVDTSNGIIDYHKENIRQLLGSKQKLSELMAVFDSDYNKKPANMALFLFGLKDNSKLKGAIDPNKVDFSRILQNDDNYRIVFILFYAAIIYHVAQIIKAKGLDMPRHIAFSGNGSKIVPILTTDNKILAAFTRCIFEGVWHKPYEGALDILGLDDNSDPKEATCKGGLLGNTTDEDDQDKIVVMKSTADSFVTSEDTYDKIGADYRKKVVDSVREFFHFVLYDVYDKFNFDRYFGITSEALAIARYHYAEDLETFLEHGIKEHLKDSDANGRIEETFFFYPIKGALNAISMLIKDSLGK